MQIHLLCCIQRLVAIQFNKVLLISFNMSIINPDKVRTYLIFNINNKSQIKYYDIRTLCNLNAE